PLEKVFSEIKRQTGYVVFFNNAFLLHAKPVTLSITAMPLKGFLPLLLKEQPFSFQIEGKTISLVPKNQTSLLKTEIEIPPIEVTGRVVNENGEGISASIRVRGTNSGTTTSESGRFSLMNVSDNAVLVISSIGFT